MVGAIEAPVLVVHGEDDAHFPVGEAPDLVAAAVDQAATGGTFPPRSGTGSGDLVG